MSFEKFAKVVCGIDDLQADAHFSSQFNLISHKGKLLCDHVGRVESLKKDFEPVAKRLGIKNADLPWENATVRSPDYREYYSGALKSMVEQRYAADIERFGYEF